jgi:hypothetical protein
MQFNETFYPLSFSPPRGKARMGVFINTEKAINIKIKNCYMNCEELHSYRELSGQELSGWVAQDIISELNSSLIDF